MKKWQSFLCNHVAEIISEICDVSRKQIFNRKRACSSPNDYYTDMLRYKFPFFLTVDLYKTGKTSRIPSNSLLNIWKYLINKKKLWSVLKFCWSKCAICILHKKLEVLIFTFYKLFLLFSKLFSLVIFYSATAF